MQASLAPDLISIIATPRIGVIPPAARSWRSIARAGWNHYRQGGFGQFARATVGFLKRQLNFQS